MTILTRPVRRIEGLTLDDYLASPGAYLGARAEQADVFNPIPSLERMGELEVASGRAQEVRTLDDTGAPLPEEPFVQPRDLSPLLSAEEATERAGDIGLSFSEETRAEVVDILVRRRKAELARQSIARRSPGGFGLEAAALGIELLVTARDPLNVAAAFVPVVREARFAAWARSFGATGARLGRGAVEGAAGAALVEPVILSAATQEQADYDMTDSLLNIAFGTALGGGLHVGAGVAADAARRAAGRPTLAQRLQEAPHAVREAALRTAVAQSLQGRVVDVEPLLGAAGLLDSTSLSTPRARFRPQAVPGPEAPAARTPGVQAAPGPEAPAATLVALEARGDQRRVFKTEARARREAGKSRDDVEVVARPEGGFVLQRASAMEPLREPSGAVRGFPNERQARRFIARSVAPQGREALQVVPFGPAGARRYAVVRGAEPRDLAAARAQPERVSFPEIQRERISRSEPGALMTRREGPTLQQRIESAVAAGRDPRNVALADFRASARAAEAVRALPAEDTPEAARAAVDGAVQDAQEQAEALRRALGIEDNDFAAAFADIEDQVAEAEALGRAARAAALCELRS